MKPRSVVTYSDQGSAPVHEDHCSHDRDRGVFVVADGFGGPQPGAGAARLGCESMLAFLKKESGDVDATMPFEYRASLSLAGNVVLNAFSHSNRVLNERNKEKPLNQRGGASVGAGCFDRGRWIFGGVGSVWCWLLRDQKKALLNRPALYDFMGDPFFDSRRRGEGEVPLQVLGMDVGVDPTISETVLMTNDWVVIHSSGMRNEVMDELLLLHNQAVEDREILDHFQKQSYGPNASALLIRF